MSQLETIFEDIESPFEEIFEQKSLDLFDNITFESPAETLGNICLIEDKHEQSIQLRMFLKDNFEYITTNNLIEDLSGKISDDSESWFVLINFYVLLQQKFNLVLNLKTWKEIFINDIFWKLSTSEQHNFLIQKKTYFFSIYDCSQGGFVYHLKLIKIFESGKYNYHQIIEDIEDRLTRILDLFGPKIFEYLNIPLITVKQLYEFSTDQIFKYFSLIFKKIKELLEKTINQFEEFNSVCEKLEFLLSV